MYKIGWPFWKLMGKFGFPLYIKTILYMEGEMLVAEHFKSGIKVKDKNLVSVSANFSFRLKKYLEKEIGGGNIKSLCVDLIVAYKWF